MLPQTFNISVSSKANMCHEIVFIKTPNQYNSYILTPHIKFPILTPPVKFNKSFE